LWVVLPRSIGRVDTATAVDVGVSVEAIVEIHIDVVVSPTGTPTPTASPSRAHSYTNAPGNCARGNYTSIRIWRVVNRRVWIDGCSVNGLGIIGRHVHDLWICLLDDDDALVVDDLRFNFLMFVGRQGARALRLFSHSLDGVHDIALLRKKCVTQIGGPLNVIGQLLHHLGKRRHSLYAWIPRLLLSRTDERLTAQTFIFLQPLLQLNDL
jgi:hypothetical protein